MSGMKSKRVGPDLGVNYHNRVKVISGEASAQIAAKAIVRVSGLDNGLKKVTLATAADGAANELAVALHAFGAGERGEIVDWALVTDLDTSSYAVGSPWYLSESSGGTTSGAPGSAGKVVGRVVSSHASTGAVLLAPKAFSSDLLVSQVTISSAEVLALNATPKALVAAPGAGKAVLLEKAIVHLDYNSAAYVDDAGEDFVIQYDGGTALTAVIDGTLLDGTADAKVPLQALSGVPLEANVAVEAHILVGEWATGNSPIIVTVWYRVVDV